ncbi:HAD-IB family hydrolase [Clostridium botulinum]|uniref:HAD-superfamily subfamily IB hydrolase n=2 Tax=Clostridium botulinum TaxID=1491 RepID=A0A9P2G873_CLOBO|nr:MULTISPECIES: HAD-IB family hydrolase [Clostridium]EES91817.1 HAD-superfamily subfamily IB hydrolase [Clostridium botulinum D str. 1873]MBO3442038.1 HAD-IB family hydrolase [Clostridium haemolyticum]NFV47352.1 HAD-IB family hydrolase [Clostridium botulinum]QPW56127.1 HAD-IB family hydrolase [Clostridium botulinum]BAM46091.1 putative HAD-superfamily subfamily IB hydrolase [Clostridium botulinum]
MEKLGIFDVDYTLTKKETLIELYLFMLKKDPKLLRYIPRTIITGVLYGFGIYSARKSKETFIKFLDGITEDRMKKIVKEFYEERLSKILYKDAIDTIKKLKKEGCKIYLISASPEVYLNELYNIKEVDKIIGTKLKIENGAYKSIIEGSNNKGEEKVKRLKEVLKDENIEVDFKNSYMFSDSLADLPLFNLVGNPYLINSKKKYNNIKRLQWK